MFSGKKTKQKINEVYEREHRRVVVASRTASVWKQKAEDYLWLIETYIPPNDLPLWKRISHQRKELKILLDRNKKLVEQVERLQRG